MPRHVGVDELLAEFISVDSSQSPPPAPVLVRSPHHQQNPSDASPLVRRHVDPFNSNTRSSSTRSATSPLAPKDYVGATRRQNVFHLSATPSEGSLNSASGRTAGGTAHIQHSSMPKDDTVDSDPMATAAASSLLALSTSAAPSLSLSNNNSSSHPNSGAVQPPLTRVHRIATSSGGTAPPTPVPCASPHVVIVPSVETYHNHHRQGYHRTSHVVTVVPRNGPNPPSDTFLPFGDLLGSFASAAPLSPLHTYDDSDERFSGGDDNTVDDDDEGFSIDVAELASLRAWRSSAALSQGRHELLMQLLVGSSEQRERSMLAEHEMAERLSLADRYIHYAGVVRNAGMTSAPQATAFIASSLLNAQRASIYTISEQLGTVLNAVSVLHSGHRARQQQQEATQDAGQGVPIHVSRVIRLCQRETCNRQRILLDLQEDFGDIVAAHHHILTAKISREAPLLEHFAAAAASQTAASSSILDAASPPSESSLILQRSVDSEVQRMSMVLAVQLAEAKTSFELQLRHQHDVEHRAYRKEIDDKLAVRRKAELQLREEIARLKCLLASAYGTVDPPNMPSLDLELHQLPSFRAKVQQEVDRTLRASASSCVQCRSYTLGGVDRTSLASAMPPPSLTEMPSFFASPEGGNGTDSRSPYHDDGRVSAPDVPLSPGIEHLVDFGDWQR